jgi:hypothetical protein
MAPAPVLRPWPGFSAAQSSRNRRKTPLLAWRLTITPTGITLVSVGVLRVQFCENGVPSAQNGVPSWAKWCPIWTEWCAISCPMVAKWSNCTESYSENARV